MQSIKLKAVPNTIYHLGVKNSDAKTKPTITRPLFMAPAMKFIAIVILIDLLSIMPTIATPVIKTEPKKIHFLPILSASSGTNRIVVDHPAK